MSASITSSYSSSYLTRAESAAVVSHARPRLLEVDVLRGLLILLMCNTHALTLAAVAPESWLFQWWLPRGWGTHGFIIVSGFTLSFVLAIVGRSDRLSWANRRGLQLLAIAIASNVFFGVAKAVAETGTVLPVPGGYSVSAVLYPTAVLLLILPTAASVAGRLGATRFLVLACVLLAAVTAATRLPSAWWDLMLPGGTAMAGTLLMLGEGLVGYAAGLFLRTGQVRTGLVWFLVIVSVPAAFLLGDDLYAVRALARLTLLAGLVHAALSAGVLAPLTTQLALVGRYPLMAFLLHRVVMQGLRVGATRGGLVASEAEPRYWMLFLATGFVVWALARLRADSPSLDQGLKRAWL